MDIRAPTAGLLPALAFEGATKRNRPRLVPGDAVYARVEETSRDVEPELSCLASPAAAGAALGPLPAGYVLETNTAHARRLMALPPAPELVALGTSLAFEVAVGANGRVLVHSQAPRVTAAVAHALRVCADLPASERAVAVAAIVAAADRSAGV